MLVTQRMFRVIAIALVVLAPHLAVAQPAPPAEAIAPAIAFGARHAVALKTNGDVMTWGENVMCQLGRAGGNASATPGLVMRNGKEIAAASDHTLVLTTDGKVYGWGSNPEGALGTGDTYDKCDGPTLVTSLQDKTIVHIATGNGFSIALDSSGNLYCSGDNGMGQCGVTRAGRSEVFTPVLIPELTGKVVAVKSGGFHTLALTKDGDLYAFGRGRDGQLGNGRTTNGVAHVSALKRVVSFAAGTWHSAASLADGSVWLWGNNSKSQLCDGTTTNRTVPTRVSLSSEEPMAARVAAGGHTTLLHAADGRLYGCGDNQFGALGTDQPPVVPRPAVLAPGAHPSGLAVGSGNGTFSTDGCKVRISGSTDRGIAGARNSPGSGFILREGLSLCGLTAPQPLPTLLRVAPTGGVSNCWTPRLEEDGANDPAFGSLRQAMLSAEAVLKGNAAFMSAPVPVRMRTSLSAGPLRDAGARMHVKAVPERKADGTRLWTKDCTVIPQLDRIGGAITQVSIFFNSGAAGHFLSSRGDAPKLTGRVGGYPEYDGWVLITKDGRLPWIPRTLADHLEEEGARRRKALEDWNRTRAGMKAPDPAAIQKTVEMLKKTDPAGAAKLMESMNEQAAELKRQQQEVHPAMTAGLEQQVSEFEKYRASFSEAQLRSPAVRGDVSGEGKRRLDAEIAALRKAHMEKAGPLIAAASARYYLTNLQPGPADRAISFKPDPAFMDTGRTDRVQMIAVSFSEDPDPKQVERRAWQKRVKETFDFAALAALLK